eukprot:COSAG01_NODE_411_length_17360_cov_11.401852_8_plen_333_part_00
MVLERTDGLLRSWRNAALVCALAAAAALPFLPSPSQLSALLDLFSSSSSSSSSSMHHHWGQYTALGGALARVWRGGGGRIEWAGEPLRHHVLEARRIERVAWPQLQVMSAGGAGSGPAAPGPQTVAEWAAARRPRMPVVVTDTVASRWRAVGRWDPEYLSRHVSTPFTAHANSEPLFQYVDAEMAEWALPAIQACGRALRAGRAPGARCTVPRAPDAYENLTMHEFWRLRTGSRHRGRRGEAAAAGGGAAPPAAPPDRRFLYGAVRLHSSWERELVRADLRGFRTWMVPPGLGPHAARFHLWFGERAVPIVIIVGLFWLRFTYVTPVLVKKY